MAAVEKPLPQNLDAEMSMLGSMLIAPECIEDCLPVCAPGDCYREAHREIYQAAKDLHDAGTPPDLLTLSDELARRGKLEVIGGISYLSSLANGVPTSSNAVYYAQIVNRCARLRHHIAFAAQDAALAYNDMDADELDDWAAAKLAEISGQGKASGTDEPMSGIASRFRADTAKWRETPFALRGITTGLKVLDRKTGGAHRGHLWVVGARSSMGKSALALTMLRHAAFETPAGHFVAMVSLEMSKDQLFLRMAAMESGESAVAIERGDPSVDWERVDDGVTLLEQLPIRILDAASAHNRTSRSRGRMTPDELRRLCQAWRRDGAVLDMLIVDYVELMAAPAGSERLPREERLSEISKSLKALAEELQAPVIALSQLNRGTEDSDSRIPTLANIRGSDAIGNDADVVIFPVRWDYYKERGQKVPDEVKDKPYGYTDLMVAKNRNGPMGMESAFYLASQMRFCDFDSERNCPVDYSGQVIPVPVSPWKQKRPSGGKVGAY